MDVGEQVNVKTPYILYEFDNDYSYKSIQRVRERLGLKGTIQQAATFETLTEIYKVIRSRFPSMGARRMVTTIRQDYSIKIPEYMAVATINY